MDAGWFRGRGTRLAALVTLAGCATANPQWTDGGLTRLRARGEVAAGDLQSVVTAAVPAVRDVGFRDVGPAIFKQEPGTQKLVGRWPAHFSFADRDDPASRSPLFDGEFELEVTIREEGGRRYAVDVAIKPPARALAIPRENCAGSEHPFDCERRYEVSFAEAPPLDVKERLLEAARRRLAESATAQATPRASAPVPAR